MRAKNAVCPVAILILLSAFAGKNARAVPDTPCFKDEFEMETESLVPRSWSYDRRERVFRQLKSGDPDVREAGLLDLYRMIDEKFKARALGTEHGLDVDEIEAAVHDVFIAAATRIHEGGLESSGNSTSFFRVVRDSMVEIERDWYEIRDRHEPLSLQLQAIFGSPEAIENGIAKSQSPKEVQAQVVLAAMSWDVGPMRASKRSTRSENARIIQAMLAGAKTDQELLQALDLRVTRQAIGRRRRNALTQFAVLYRFLLVHPEEYRLALKRYQGQSVEVRPLRPEIAAEPEIRLRKSDREKFLLTAGWLRRFGMKWVLKQLNQPPGQGSDRFGGGVSPTQGIRAWRVDHVLELAMPASAPTIHEIRQALGRSETYPNELLGKWANDLHAAGLSAALIQKLMQSLGVPPPKYKNGIHTNTWSDDQVRVLLKSSGK